MFRKMVLVGLCLSAVSATWASNTRFKGYDFESYAITDIGYRYAEARRNQGTWIQVGRGDEYSLVIRNPLPVRVAVAVTIDGLNVIDGKRTTPDDAQKWMIDAHSSLTLRGWQTDRSSLRRFVFTDKGDSYAQWKGSQDNKAYTRNLGVIGVAYFWNRTELQAALHPPEPFAKRELQSLEGYAAGCAPAATRSTDDECRGRDIAGTGMGTRETNNVVDVEFHYDTGMYRSQDVLTIYYEFAQNTPQPEPFVSEGKFAPEMPN